jgi:multicomponent Na+:H+ antiporter subunit D
MGLPLLLPLLLPFLTAILCLIAWDHPRVQRVLTLAGTAALLAAGIRLVVVVRTAGIQSLDIGSWQAPYGITLVADLFSAIMIIMVGLMGLTIAIYSLASMDAARESFGYYPLFNFLLMGVSGAFLTGDIFNLYVWFEVMLIASFVLLALGGEWPQLQGAIKYVTLNLVSSTIFLTAVGVLYGLTGMLNMADIAQQFQHNSEIPEGLILTLAALFLVAFGVKAALFPLFFWLPDSYHTPPVSVTAIFSALLSKVGVYALARVFTLFFAPYIDTFQPLLLTIAALTMVTGVLGAVAQYDFRRLLSFHIISQIGYLLMAIALFSHLALTGLIFFMAHVIVAKSALFLVSGLVYRLRGSYGLKELGGVYRDYPGVAALFLVAALALAGIPPFSGFWAKLALIRAGLAAGQYAVVGVALSVSLLTLFSMIKIWAEVFWKDAPALTGSGSGSATATLLPRSTWSLYLLPIILLVIVGVVMGLTAEPFFNLAQQAADQLLNPALYIEAVLPDL